MKAFNRLTVTGALAAGFVACTAPVFDLPKEVAGKTFYIHTPADCVARQLESRDQSKDSLQISNSDSPPLDKDVGPNQFPGKIQINIRLLGRFEGTFPVPAGATDEGKALKGTDDLESRSWIHSSASPHELGLMHTYLISGKGRLYQLHTWARIDQREVRKMTALLDQMVLSMKIR